MGKDFTLSADTLKAISIFQTFNDDELNQLLALGQEMEYEPYTNIIIEGELSWGLYIIIDGSVDVIKTNKLTGTSYELGQLKAGNFFGEMSLVDDSPRSATVKSITAAKVFFLPKQTFMEFLETALELKARFLSNCIHQLIKRLRQIDDDYIICQFQLWQTALKKEKSAL